MTVTCDKCNSTLANKQTLKKHQESGICKRRAEKIEKNDKGEKKKENKKDKIEKKKEKKSDRTMEEKLAELADLERKLKEMDDGVYVNSDDDEDIDEETLKMLMDDPITKKIINIEKEMNERLKKIPEKLENMRKNSKKINDLEERIKNGKEYRARSKEEIKIWDIYIGRRTGELQCPYCIINKMSQFEFEVRYDRGGGDNIDNYRPICLKCGGKTKNLEFDIIKWEVGRGIDTDAVIKMIGDIVKEGGKFDFSQFNS